MEKETRGLEPYVFTKVQRWMYNIIKRVHGLKPYVFAKVQKIIG